MSGRLLALLLVTLPAVGSAQNAPPDPHIQSAVYDEGRIVPLRIAPGFVATVTFAGDERIENVAVGNPAAWQITANKQGDRLFIRALQAGGTTNLEVVTEARHYSFLLTTSSAGDSSTVFSFHFDYGPGAGAPPRPAAALAPAPATAEAPGQYRLSGSRRLRPVTIADDGRTTRICWPPRAPIPAILARDAGGGERIVNSRVVGGCSVIDALWPSYRFVADGDSVTARRLATPGRQP